tara:strand:+ start:730 stop:933 length:204 start_codon:yes stop_codon:yes gene_type:complete
MKGVKHYLKDGTEYNGPTHKMPNGHVHTGKTHNESSQRVFHRNELSKMNYSPKRKKKKKKKNPLKIY